MTKSEFSAVRTGFRGLTTARICAFRYEIYYKTFTKMFPMPSRKATVHYLPGNNDVGLNVDPIESLHARRRFTRHFGPLDQTVVIQNHTLVLLDASGLIEESYRRKPATREHEFPEGGTMSFARSVQPGSLKILRSFPDCSEDLDFYPSFRTGDKAHPVILFTHIPLFRPEGASCGPLRELGTIRRGAGPNYQSTIGKDISALLLDHLHPTVIFRSVTIPRSRSDAESDRSLVGMTETIANSSTIVRVYLPCEKSRSSRFLRPGAYEDRDSTSSPCSNRRQH